MRILFDQGTPVQIKPYLAGHEIRTAHELGWSTVLNGELLRAAEAAGFELFLTTDTHIIDQQNLKKTNLAIVVLNRNRWKSILEKIHQVVAAVESAKPGTLTIVTI
jgi:hypothetical protein